MNQITGNAVGGKLRVSGSTDEPAKVKVNGKAAQTNAANFFEAWVDVTAGQNTLTVEAEDFSPANNKRTNSWTVNVTGTAAGTPSYDLNGNMTNNGFGQTYQWDAENRLVKITYADLSSTEFAYDGLSRRTRITEKTAANTITSDKRYVWSGGNQPAEERDTTTNAVTKRFFAEGEQRIGGVDAGFYYYAKDHLGSIREITNSTGAIAAGYDFDLWGKRVKLSGTFESEVGYTGHHHHAKSGLVLTWYRAYDAELGRWLSADPIWEKGGLNLYGYVGNEPVNGWDPLGLVDMNISPRNKPIEVMGMDHWNPQNGTFTVGGHGSACGKGMKDAQGNPLSAERLAQLIRNSSRYKEGQTVTLYMCNTGGYCPSGPNFAQQLANALGVPVRAPNGYVKAKVYPNSPSEVFLSDNQDDDIPSDTKSYKYHKPEKSNCNK